ncbi:hypothetical protein MFIFM68171_10476 [Madurella fahalii]|uniref:Uncharacterized protein n=1 Tax=Madurella fahalii TaxID=1157608 RepID=A0ABQ0GR98_9PEZI
MKLMLLSNLLAVYTYYNAVLAGSTHKQTGPFFLRVNAPNNGTVDGQYLTPLVVDSAIVGLHFRLSRPCKEESAFFFDFTVADGVASQTGLLRHWPKLPDAIYASRFWQTMAFEQPPGYNLAVPRFVKAPSPNMEYIPIGWDNDTLYVASQPGELIAKPKGSWHACNLVYYKDRRLPIPYHGVAWVYNDKPVDPTCTPISIHMEDALGSHQASGIPVMPTSPAEDAGGEDESERDETGCDVDDDEKDGVDDDCDDEYEDVGNGSEADGNDADCGED